MAKDATHADFTLSTRSVREPYASSFDFTSSGSGGDGTTEPSGQTFTYAATDPTVNALSAPEPTYDFAHADASLQSDDYIDVFYPAGSDGVSSSFQTDSQPRVLGELRGSATDVAATPQSAYGLSPPSGGALGLSGTQPVSYLGQTAQSALQGGVLDGGLYEIAPLLLSPYVGLVGPKIRGYNGTQASILGGADVGDGAVVFDSVQGEVTVLAEAVQSALYTQTFVDPFARVGFFPEHRGLFSPVDPIGEVYAGTPRRIFGGSARINATLEDPTVSGRSHTGRSLRADVASVSGHTIGTHRLDTLTPALLDTSIPIPSIPLAVTPGVAASREIGDDVYEAGRHLGLTMDSDVQSSEYEDGLALALAIGPTAEDSIYPFAQALGDGIGLDPGDDVYRGSELSPEAFSVVTVTNDTYVLAYEEGDVYVLYPVFRRLSGDFDANELWVKQGVKIGDDVVWTGHGSPGGLSL